MQRKIRDSDGNAVTAGCVVSFCYGIPVACVRAPVIDRDGVLIAMTDGHKPSECSVAHLRRAVGDFYVIDNS